jgi:uncharacterized integral membrane protein
MASHEAMGGPVSHTECQEALLSDPTASPRRRGRDEKPATRGERRRTLAAALLGGLLAVFAVLNIDDVKVNWIVTSTQTPLILVIAVVFALGVGFGALWQRRRGKRPPR